MEAREVVIAVLLGAVLVVCSVDVITGHYVDQTGVVSGHNWYTTTDCDDDGCETDTHYQLIVSHGAEVTVVGVWVWQYYSYKNGDRVRITYWKGGLVGAKWFAGVGKPKQDW